MGSIPEVVKLQPHAVIVPYPAQGHVNPMTKLAKILHSKGFFITYVNTEFNHKRLLRARGPNALDGLPDFRYATIPDGLPPSDADANATQDVLALCLSTSHTCLEPFLELMASINEESASHGLVPPVTCIVSDALMTFSVKAANILGIPSVLLWTSGACGLLGYYQYRYLHHNGFIPIQDESYLSNGNLETKVEWVPGINHLRLRDIPNIMNATNPEMVNFFLGELETAHKASFILINTFEEFEKSSINYLSSTYSAPILTVGPLPLLLHQTNINKELSTIGSNLWKEDSSCLRWLHSQAPSSVFYVNYGSITTVTSAHLTEFGWGLAASNHPFLWVIRPDMVEGGSAIFSSEFKKEIEGRGMIVSWCSQEDVLNHPAVGGFLTHCGWNSMVESVCAGKPVVCVGSKSSDTNFWASSPIS